MPVINVDAEPIPHLNIPVESIGNYEVHVFPTVAYINDAGQARNPGTLEEFGSRIGAHVWKFGMSAPDGVPQVDAGQMENTPAGVTFAALIVLKSNGRKVVDFSVFGRGFRVPSSPTSTTWADIGAYNRGIIPEQTQSATVSGPLTVAGLSTFDGAAIFNGPVNILDGLTVEGLHVTGGPVLLDNGLIVTGGGVFSGNVEAPEFEGSGALLTDVLHPANNLSEVNPALSRAHLGLGSLSLQDAANILVTGGVLRNVTLEGVAGIPSASGGVSNPNTTVLEYDSDNDGIGFFTVRRAGVDKFRIENDGRFSFMGGGPLVFNPVADASEMVLLIANPEPGEAPSGILRQTIINDDYPANNSMWNGTRDEVLAFGHNLGVSGRANITRPLSGWYNELAYVTSEGICQNEVYLQLEALDNSSWRPFGITSDWDAKSSVIQLFSPAIFGDKTGNNPGLTINNGVVSFLTPGGSINFADRTDPFLIINGQNILTWAHGEDGHQTLNILDGGNNNATIRYGISDDATASAVFTMLYGSDAHARGLRWYGVSAIGQGWQFQGFDGAWNAIGNVRSGDITGESFVKVKDGGDYLYFADNNGSDFQLSIDFGATLPTKIRSYQGILFQTHGGNDRFKIDDAGAWLWNGSTLKKVNLADADGGRQYLYVDA